MANEELAPLGGTLAKPDITLTNTPPVQNTEPPVQAGPPATPLASETPAKEQPVAESGGVVPPGDSELPLEAEVSSPQPEGMTVPESYLVAGPGAPRTPRFPRGELGRMITAEAAIKMSGFARRLLEAPLEIGAKKFNIPLGQDEEGVNTLLNALAQEYKGIIAKGKRGVIPDDVLRELAKETGLTVNDVRSYTSGKVVNAENMLAANTLLGYQGLRVKAIEKMIKAEGLASDPEAQKLFENELVTLLDVEARTRGVSSELGRALRANQVEVPGLSMAREIADFTRQVNEPSGQGRQRLLALIGTLDDAQQIRQVAAQMNKKPNAFLEIWLNSLLSGPGTHVANTAGNTIAAVNGVTERLIAGGVGAIRRGITGANDGVYIEEGIDMLSSMVAAATDANKAAYKLWKTGESETSKMMGQANKFNLRTGRAITLQGDNMFAAGIRGLGEAINLPTTALMTEDEWFKMFNFQLGLRGAAIGQAKAQGLVGREFQNEVGRMMQNPSFFSKAYDEAVDYAKYTTFNRDLGKLGAGIRDASNSYPIFKMIMPFTTAPANLAYYAFERTPGIQMLSIKLWKDMGGANGARARDLAIAKYAEGQMVALSVAGMVYGGMITGRGPLDPQVKKDLMATGWKPYSFHPPGTNLYISYDRLDPLGMYFGAIADSTQILASLPKHDAETLAAGTVVAMSGVVMNKTYLQGIQGVITALDAARKGDVEGSDIGKYLDGYAASAVPAIVAQFTQANDPYFRDVKTWQDAIYNRLPGWAPGSYDIPVLRDVYGRPTLREGLTGWTPADAVLSPFKTGTLQYEPGLKALIENGVSIAPLSRTLVGPSAHEVEVDSAKASKTPGVSLTPKEYDRWGEILMTLRVGGKTLKQALDELAESDNFKAHQMGPDKGQAIRLRNKITEYRQRALNQLRHENNNEIQNRIADYYHRKAEGMRIGPAYEAQPGNSPDSGSLGSTAPVPASPPKNSPTGGIPRLTQ